MGRREPRAPLHAEIGGSKIASGLACDFFYYVRCRAGRRRDPSYKASLKMTPT